MTEIRGIPVQAPGTYVLLEDVVAAIREYAQAQDDPNAGALVHDLATWLDGGLPETHIASGQSPPSEPEVQEILDQKFQWYPGNVMGPVEPEVHGAEIDDVTEGVARVEIYPDNPDDPRPKWYARTVDTAGYIIKTTNGSFDQAWVIQNAEERFPGIPIHLLKHAGEDSKWQEDSTRGVFPSIGPPVRRMFAGVSAYERNEHGGGQVGP